MRTVPATAEHVPFLLERMGPARVALVATVLDGPARGIERLIDASTLTWCGIDAAGVVTMGGVFPYADEPGTGYAWQFITDAVRHHKRAYLDQGRAMHGLALRQYNRLTALIETDATAALRHAQRNGWVLGGVEFAAGYALRRCFRSI